MLTHLYMHTYAHACKMRLVGRHGNKEAGRSCLRRVLQGLLCQPLNVTRFRV